MDGKQVKCELYNDNFQNWKKYPIQKAQLVIADIPYNIGTDAYGSSPLWWRDGDRRNSESSKAGKTFFNTDINFNIAEYFHFCNRLLKYDKPHAPREIRLLQRWCNNRLVFRKEVILVEHLGDITKLNGYALPAVDVIIGGSPC